jgi:hypothetical protein
MLVSGEADAVGTALPWHDHWSVDLFIYSFFYIKRCLILEKSVIPTETASD